MNGDHDCRGGNLIVTLPRHCLKGAQMVVRQSSYRVTIACTQVELE